MPIEFRCQQCKKLLRVADESAGAKARCPQCGTIVDVPNGGDTATNQQLNPFGEGATSTPQAGSSGSAEDNPYVAPGGPAKPTSVKWTLAGDVVPTHVDPGTIIGHAWDVWKANLGLVVGITVVMAIPNIGLGLVQAVVEAIVSREVDPALGPVAGIPVSLLNNLVQMFLGIGAAHIFLKLLRGQAAEFSELFGGGPLFLRLLGASILAGIALMLGLLACLIPAIVLLIIFWPFYYLIVDHKANAIESFSMAAPIGQANVGTSIVLWLVSLGIVLVGLFACVVGLFLAVPLASLIWGSAYLMMTGQLRSQPA